MNPERVLSRDAEPSRPPRVDFARIAAMLAARAEDVCRNYLLTSGKRVGREWKCGDAFNSPGNSMAVSLWGEDAGLWFDQATKQGGNLLQLVAVQTNLSIGEAAKIACEILRVDPLDVAAADTSPPSDRQGRPIVGRRRSPVTVPIEPPDNVRQLWRDSSTCGGTFGQDYLIERGILLPPPATIRFNPRLPYWHAVKGRDKPVCLGHYPALICGISFWPNHKVVALQRIYLDPEHPRKLKLPDPDNPDRLLDAKKTLGAFKGGAVRLSPYAGDLMLCEGVETALTVLSLWHGKAAVWATCGTVGMAEVLVPEGGIKRLCIDNDPPGVAAATALIRRINGPSENIIVYSPKTNDDNSHLNDFNDFIMPKGA